MVSKRDEVLKLRDPQGRTHYMKGPDFRDMAPDTEAFPNDYPGLLRMDLKQIGAAVVREDELLTLTSREAAEHGFLKRTFADGRKYVETEEELLDALKAEGADVSFVSPTFSENASEVLLQIAGILSAIIAIAVLVTIWQGPGVMTIVGVVALILVLLVSATADLLHGFPIFLLVVGILLLAAEVFLIPGFGVAGLLGFAAIGTGFLFLASGATIGDTRGLGAVALDFSLQFVATILVGITAIFVVSRYFPSLGPGRRLLLQPPEGPPVSTKTPAVPDARIGTRGRALSALRPAGTAEIDGRMVDVVTDGDWVRQGATVEVVSIEGNRVTVQAVDGPDDEDED
jgi:membrane-bound serine protease (ClpP class)